MIDVPILVKDALKDGRRKKNYRILVLNDDGTTDFVIDNNTLVSEQADIDERMCSGDTIKFGLCEGSSFQFQYFDHPNITDRQIQVFIDAQYIGTEYENVQKFQRYRYITLEEGGNYRAYSANANGFSVLYLLRNGSTQQLTPTSTDTETYVEFNGMVGDMLEVEWTQFPLYDTYLQKQTSDMLLEYPIPMGFFTVKNCSRQASTGIMKVTAYNKLQSNYLDQKANTLLLDTLTSTNKTLTMFDIRYLLLNDYQIIEKREAIPASNPSSVIESVFSNLGFFGFTQTYGIKSPINPITLGSTEDFPLTLISQQIDYAIGMDQRNILFDSKKGSLIGLEKYLVNFIKKTINDAKLTVDGDTAINTICSGNGFQNVICIKHHTNEGTVIVTRVYSTVQWDYEEEHGINHTVDGRIADIQSLVDGPGSYTVIIPDEISSNLQTVFSLSGGGTYEYYLDESMTTKGTEYNPFLTFSDGSQYQYYDSENEIYSLLPWKYTDLSDADLVTVQTSTVPDFTLRNITSAVYETLCQFGKLDRVTDLFAGVELNQSRLLPQIDLYPDTALYPAGAQSSSFKSMYSKLWADEGNVQKWRNLIITYKGLDENNQEKEFTLQRQINADGTQDYNMSDNWLFKNLIWTSQKVGDYADAMVAKMRDITWFPFEMWCAGIPYLETGDEIEITVNQSTYTSYVLQRQLKGIQNLQDTFINGTLDIF